ncbi:Lysophospholipase, alpha-beta hydrolase superfamily [Arthrobacter alpinus]|uniref:Lysophospholipase, alpha-beta hydrolase superfamily n=1 Tax=Arthrobacter alpinus TaxID=656366 RepID=A0A1H5H8M0_9MICC|nr:alpha/beta fold hydrolase [Arthrobacter alpinus]SEE24322.1 Lysophospholipase, alpha-beta hydrolase superfamily [Arthrobacter alpinus]
MATSETQSSAWLKWGALGAGAVGAGAVAVVTATSGLAAYFARRVVTPDKHRPDDLAILAVIADGPRLQVVLEATPDTIIEGNYGLFFSGSQGHAIIGPIISYVPREGSITREVVTVHSGDLRTATAGWWSGNLYSHPEQMGLESEDVTLNLPDGPAPAWLVPAPNPGHTWAIMVHGRGATRIEGLRAVPTAHRLGMNALLISYRNDGDAPKASDGRYGLGVTEWADVEVAIDFAISRGAKDVVLFGNSMGGAISLQTADVARNRKHVLAMVLDGPVINWIDVLAHQAQLNKIPNYIGRYAQLMLTHPLGRRITGLAAPVNFKSLDWVSRAVELRTPSLILHSIDDDFVPYGPTAELAKRNPEMVTFEPFSKARHTKEWNVEPSRWENAVEAWLRPRLGRYTLPRE